MVGFFLSKTASAAPGRTIEDVKTALSGNGHPPSAVDTTNIEAKESLGAGILRRARERSKSVASTLSRQEPESTERELLDVPSSEGNNQQTEDVIAHPGSLPDNDKGSISNRLASLARLSGSSSTTTPVPSSVQSHTPSRPSVQSIFASFTSPATSLRSGASSFHEGSPPAGPTPLPEEAQSRRGSTSLDLADGAMSRFMETKSALDLRLSDVQSLLDDYKRLGRLFELQKAQSTSL